MVLMKHLSLRVKVALMIFTVSISVMLVVFGYVLYSDIQLFQRFVVNNTMMQARLIGESAKASLEFDYPVAAFDMLDKLAAIPQIEVGLVYGKNNQIFAEYYRNPTQKDVPHPQSFASPYYFYQDQEFHIYHPIYSKKDRLGMIYLQVSNDDLQAQIHDHVKTMVGLAAVIIIVAFVYSLFVQRFITRSILDLAKTAQKISQNVDYSLRVEHSRHDEIGILIDSFNEMLRKIEVREWERDSATAELQKRTDDLSLALKQLKNTQDQLILSEKMAALGQLIAGIAHEINTPLGAIRSSVENIIQNLETFIFDLVSVYRAMDEKELKIFLSLLHASFSNNVALSSREERQLKRKLRKKLESLQIKNADSKADTLSDMHIFEPDDVMLEFFYKMPDSDILRNAYRVSGLLRSSQTIETATNKAANVVQALKSYSHTQMTKEKVMMDVRTGIETVLTLFHNMIKHGVQVEKEYEDVPEILCFPDELNQVWANLIQNALHAMEEHGLLKIEVKQYEDQILVAITDNGKGISPDLQEKIFEPFFTTKGMGEGSGLGLDIVKRIVEKHQGKIALKSQPGQTTFSIFLPTTSTLHEESVHV